MPQLKVIGLFLLLAFIAFAGSSDLVAILMFIAGAGFVMFAYVDEDAYRRGEKAFLKGKKGLRQNGR